MPCGPVGSCSLRSTGGPRRAIWTSGGTPRPAWTSSFFEPAELEVALEANGFSVQRIMERPPYVGSEAETDRFYIFARKPPEQRP